MSRIRIITVGVVLVITVAAILILLLGGSDSDDEPDVVKVAIMLPIHVEIGQDMLHAAELALSQRNGRAGDVRVEIVTYNGFEVDPEEQQPAQEDILREIIADDSIVAVIGAPNSAAATFTIPMLNAAPLVLVSPSATWPGLTKAGFGVGEPGIYYPTGQRNFFRVIPSDDVQGLVAARWMQQQGYQRIFVVTFDTAYSVGLAGIMQANAADLGLEVVGSEAIDPAALTPEIIQVLADKIEAAEIDVLYFPVPSALGGYELLLALFEHLPDLVVLSGDGLVAETLLEDVTHSEQIYATNVLDAAYIEAANEFVAAFQSAYDKTPPPFALTTYEAMGVILEAVDQAESPSRTGVLQAIQQIEAYDGAMGVWQFDENGDTTLTTVGIMQLRDGQWEVIGVIE